MNIAALLNISFSRVEDMLMNELHKNGFNDIRPVHGKILGYINREEGSQLVELAQRAKVTKQFMSQLAQQIEAMGYIKKVAHHSDKRSQLVKLTPKGEQLIEAADNAFQRIETSFKKQLSAERYKALRQCLEQIIVFTD
jgi:DNA-binding MarR family transcriptional regulator